MALYDFGVCATSEASDGLTGCLVTILSKWFLPSRLETRTKESNIYASVLVYKPIRETKVKCAKRKLAASGRPDTSVKD